MLKVRLSQETLERKWEVKKCVGCIFLDILLSIIVLDFNKFQVYIQSDDILFIIKYYNFVFDLTHQIGNWTVSMIYEKGH